MTADNTVIAIYSSHAAAEEAVKELRVSGFEMKKLSIIGQDIHTDEKALKTGRFLLIAHGIRFDANLAREILDRTGPETLDHRDHGTSELRTCAKP